MRAQVRPFGDRALLAEVGDTDEVLALAASIDAARWPEVVDVVPAERTVLVVTRPGADLSALAQRLAAVRGVRTAGPEPETAEVVTVPVHYDGPDLAEVAALTGLSERAVVAAHVGSSWRVAFTGFTPGFGYLVGGDRRLRVPRRDRPRTAVPAGAVGLADAYSGIYPRSSPGGWQLIGRTEAPLWRIDRDPPALLRPGGRVRFVEAAS